MKIIRIVASVLIVAFLIFAPAPLRRALQRDPMRELFESDPPDWYGIIDIWHIAGFRTYQGSVTTFLEDCCDAFSKEHPGVHFEVSGLTPAMYEDRTARGLAPDAYSFPAGFLSKELAAPLSADCPILIDGLAIPDKNSDCSAIPYLFSGYFLLFNEQITEKEGFSVPDTADADLLLQLHENGVLSFPESIGRQYALSGDARDYSDFLKGSCMAAVTDARGFGDLMRDTEQNLLIKALPLAGFTDQVMYLSTAADTDAQRAAYLNEFYAYLLSETIQQKIAVLGAMPVRKYLAQLAYSPQLLETWYAAHLTGIKTIAPLRE